LLRDKERYTNRLLGGGTTSRHRKQKNSTIISRITYSYISNDDSSVRNQLSQYAPAPASCDLNSHPELSAWRSLWYGMV